MRRWLIGLAVTLFLAVAGTAAWITVQGDALFADGAVTPIARKTFSAGIAEKLRFRDFEHLGVDLLAFEAMRIEKLRRGGITLGAFNVLVLDGVTVNLAENHSTLATDDKAAGPPSFDFIARFKSAKSLTAKKFSSVRISRLEVNRWTAGETERLFTAESAESSLVGGKTLRLKGCRVFDGDGKGVTAHDARVEVEPEPMLVYRHPGEREKRMPIQ